MGYNIKEQAKLVCERCSECKFLDLNKGQTRLFCNELDRAITGDDNDCKDFKRLEIHKTKSAPLKNEKQEAFCQHYIITLNGAEAARQAGYSVKTARTIGSKLLTKVDVQKRLDALIEERNERFEITQDDVLRDIEQVKDRCMASVPVQVWHPGLEAYIDKIDENGRTIYEFQSHSALKALELLGKHTGAFEKHNKQKAGTVTIFEIPSNGRENKPEK